MGAQLGSSVAFGSGCGQALPGVPRKGRAKRFYAFILGSSVGGFGSKAAHKRRIKGMYRQRIQKAWGHTAHRGWARLLLNRARDLIIHDPAHRGANGAAMPTDEDDQDGHFFFNHPEKGGYSCSW